MRPAGRMDGRKVLCGAAVWAFSAPQPGSLSHRDDPNACDQRVAVQADGRAQICASRSQRRADIEGIRGPGVLAEVPHAYTWVGEVGLAAHLVRQHRGFSPRARPTAVEG